MSKQNIYDNDAFFEHFRSNRENEVNFNDCVETPILLAMLSQYKWLSKSKVVEIIEVDSYVDFVRREGKR